MQNPTPAFALTAIVCFAAVSAHAIPSHLWSKGFGDTGFDIGYAVAPDGSDNGYLAGYFNGTVDFGGGNLTSAGSNDVFLAKYDDAGVHIWSKQFGASGFDDAYGVAVDGADNVYVVGYFNGTVDFGGGGLISAGSGDIFIAKYNSAGTHLWSKRFGSTLLDLGLSVAVDGSNNVLLTGSFRGTVDFGGGGLAAPGGSDVVVAKFDANGTHVWSQRFGSTLSEVGNTVAVDALDNVIVGGQFQGTVSFGGGALVASSTDMFLAKYNSAGVHQWSVDFGGTGSDIGIAAAIDASGNVFYTGYFSDTVNFGGGNRVSVGGTDIFLAKYNSAGAHQWSHAFGSVLNDEGKGLAVDSDGNATMTGEYQGTVDFGGGGLMSAGTWDMIVATYDAAGAHQWSERFGSTDADGGRSVAVDGSDNLLVTGQFRLTVDFGGGGLMSAGQTDIFVIKYGSTATGLGSTPKAALAVSSFPNPFNPRTTIRNVVPSDGLVTVAVFDASGAWVATLVEREFRFAGDHRVDWNGRSAGSTLVSSGVYFARVEQNGVARSAKLVLLK